MKLLIILLIVGGLTAVLVISLLKPAIGDFTQQEVDQIVKGCGVSADRLNFRYGGVVIVEPAPDDAAGQCMMQKLLQLRMGGKKSISIVANQLHTPDN
jgi:hypothetical protein